MTILDRARQSFLSGVWRWYRSRRLDRKLRQGEKRGRLLPPPHFVKQKVLRDYASRYNLRVLVETGTYYGDMIDRLTMLYNRSRQAQITKELIEIISGAEAL